MIFRDLNKSKIKLQEQHEKEITTLKTTVEKEKEEMKRQFQVYCEEIKFLYDKEKSHLKVKITELSSTLSNLEKDKESNSEVVKNSLHEVNIMYHQKIDYLQNELLETRTEASTRLINLTKELNMAQTQNKEYESTIGQLRQKLKESRYQHDIAQKAINYKLEKTE